MKESVSVGVSPTSTPGTFTQFQHPYNQGKSNFLSLASIGKGRGTQQTQHHYRPIDPMQFQSFKGWTPEDIMLKRNYEIQNLKHQTRVLPPSTLVTNIQNIREKHTAQQLQNTLRKGSLSLKRPRSQQQMEPLLFGRLGTDPILANQQASNYPNQFLTLKSANQSPQKTIGLPKTQQHSPMKANVPFLKKVQRGQALSLKPAHSNKHSNNVFSSCQNQEAKQGSNQHQLGQESPSPVFFDNLTEYGTSQQNDKFDGGIQSCLVRNQVKPKQIRVDIEKVPRTACEDFRPSTWYQSNIASIKSYHPSLTPQSSLPIGSQPHQRQHQQSKQKEAQGFQNKNIKEAIESNKSLSEIVGIEELLRDAQQEPDEEEEAISISPFTTVEEYLKQFRAKQKEMPILEQQDHADTPEKEDKKFLSSNDQLFMNCFQCTTLPSPPNIPVAESIKITNYSERDRYYKIANELQKLKKIVQNDPANQEYYVNTYLSKSLKSTSITETHTRAFLGYLENYDLPPFISGITFKEMLLIIISDKLSELLRVKRAQSKKSVTSKTDSFSGQSDNRTKRVTSSQQSLKDKISTYQKQLRCDFSRFNFSRGKLLRQQDKVQNLRQWQASQHTQKKLHSKTLNSSAINSTSQINSRLKPNKLGGASSQPSLENFMLKRMEQKEQAQSDINRLTQDGFSSTWNSRRQYWDTNPILQKNMSHIQFFLGNKQQ